VAGAAHRVDDHKGPCAHARVCITSIVGVAVRALQASLHLVLLWDGWGLGGLGMDGALLEKPTVPNRYRHVNMSLTAHVLCV
jgi:hypothetical protein